MTKLRKRKMSLQHIESKITKLEGEIEVLTPWQALDISFEALNELNMASYFLEVFQSNMKNNLMKV